MPSYRLQKQALLAAYEQNKRGTAPQKLLQSLSLTTDQTLEGLWNTSGLGSATGLDSATGLGSATALGSATPLGSASGAALLAVGGYGRGELFPYSDIDVLLLLPTGTDLETDAKLKSKIENFIGTCWDSGLEIGSSVRTLQECMDEAFETNGGDITIQTALLESRHLCGDAHLSQALQGAFTKRLNAAAFVTAKTLEMQQRHNKFEGTPYALEPNCKESPGGLRDLQMLLWLTKAAGLGGSWDALVANHLVTALEAKQLKKNERVLSQIRIYLHLAAKRREDRLVFDLQTQVASKFGYTSESNRKNSEQLMRHYYWAAKAVVQLHQIVLLNIESHLSPRIVVTEPIDAYFSDSGGLLDINSDDVFEQTPSTILRAFWHFQTKAQINGFTPRLTRALYNARDRMDARFRADPVNRQTFLAIMQHGSGLTHTLRLLNQTSVLGRYLWAFRRIVGQMQHDLFHVYTVDQHILMVQRNVRRFFLAEHAHEYPFCSQLAGNWDKPWILYIAALFHDIAKGRGGDHSELGVLEVQKFCKQHGIDKNDADLIAFLVKEHLTMSQVAQKQDLSDQGVIAAFAARVGSQRYLTALYLLTVADIRGTSPKVWNAWKGKLLEDLFKLTTRTLGGQVSDADSLVQTTKREASVALQRYGLVNNNYQALWDTLDVSYFMRQDSGDVAWQTRMLLPHVGSVQPLVRARLSPIGEGLQVLVYSPDMPDLFARICSYFERGQFSIWDAKIHTTNTAHALDSFVVTNADIAKYHRELIPKMQDDLAAQLQTQNPLPSISASRASRRVKSFPIQPRVELRPDERGQKWILNVSASDRVGLLFAIARVLSKHHISLQLAKIATLGERVEDSFVLDGVNLSNAKTVLAVETEILAALS